MFVSDKNVSDQTAQLDGSALEMMASSRSARQRTLKSSISCNGVGLHTGEKVTMTLRPAEPNTGIVFKRMDIAGKGAEIKASYDNVVDTRMCTVLGALNKDGEMATIGTVEHLMAALAAMRVDNALIEVNAPEAPVMDGSASPFVFLIECAGVVEQDVTRKAIKVIKPVEVVEDGKRAALLPADEGLTIDFSIEFDSKAIGTQSACFAMSETSFKNELCRARTFGRLEEVAQLQAAGLAKGGSLDNAVVVSGDKVLNEDGLRYDDEFVRHKILDALGDLYTAGAPIIGLYQGEKAGHDMTNKLLRKLLADESAFLWVDAPADLMARAPSGLSKSATKGKAA